MMKKKYAYDPHEELTLNFVEQNIKIKKMAIISYEWDTGIFVFALVLPKGTFKKSTLQGQATK